MMNFIHFVSSMSMWQILCHAILDYILCEKEYSKNMLSMSSRYSLKDSIMFTCSHSCSHVHKIASLSQRIHGGQHKQIGMLLELFTILGMSL
jgi:hypothetical protein